MMDRRVMISIADLTIRAIKVFICCVYARTISAGVLMVDCDK